MAQPHYHNPVAFWCSPINQPTPNVTLGILLNFTKRQPELIPADARKIGSITHSTIDYPDQDCDPIEACDAKLLIGQGDPWQSGPMAGPSHECNNLVLELPSSGRAAHVNGMGME